ncbi:MAG: FHA domain-containing protein [Oscillospiraceae bacterium]|nr:FHA domain-containing protein [Oscillospiraceae bacterium]
MMYEIQSVNDFLTGSSLVIRVPEKEIDYNALHTIQADCPSFIVPFHYKADGKFIEIVHKIGTQCKLQYFSGEVAPNEYSALWQSLLMPLLDCKDWFMNPCSFVLNSDYLYYDKTKNTISYIYIPSTSINQNSEDFYKMAVDVSKMITVSDAALENKVLRAIIKDFNPSAFLQMLNDHTSKTVDATIVNPVYITNMPQEKHVQQLLDGRDSDEMQGFANPLPLSDINEDFDIHIQPEIKAKQRKKDRESVGLKIFSGKSKSKRKNITQSASSQEVFDEPEASIVPLFTLPVPVASEQDNIIEITQNEIIPKHPQLRYIGYANLPSTIQITIDEGEIFTIGRFDAAIGKRQSSFEFEKKTKAVSRRHAVIERDSAGYKIIDLSSSAGTFIDNKRLPPNTPHGLEKGCRVSFGNSGADYVWEAS